MTLVTPTRRRPPAYHKKVSGSHHRRSKAYNKTYWPYLPMVAIVIVGALFNTVINGKHSVLGYATDMSVSELLIDTNSQRESNGETDLSLNGQLNNAAQSKANDMAARDYWSHNTPDGQTPWSFMSAAGYNYQLAGENLAYGFTTASETITGWMNSPEHRANILNAGYKEVGFGFINIANYQGTGPETLVVAMYGTQPAPKPAPVAAATPSAASGSQSGASAGAVAQDTSQQATQPTTPAADTPKPVTTQTDTLTPTAAQKAAQATPEKHIARAQLLTAGKAPWSMFILSLAGSCALIIFLLRHGFAWHKIFVKGERFLLQHPWLDALLVAVITLSVILVHQAGVIR